jgi:hypothetical protein
VQNPEENTSPNTHTAYNQVMSVKGIQPASRFFNGHLTPLSNTAAQQPTQNHPTTPITPTNNTNNTSNTPNSNPNNTNTNQVASSLQLNKNETNLIKRKLSKSIALTNSAHANSSQNNANIFMNTIGNYNGYYNSGNTVNSNGYANIINNNNTQTTSPLKHAPNIPLLQAKKYANEYKNSSRFLVKLIWLASERALLMHCLTLSDFSSI